MDRKIRVATTVGYPVLIVALWISNRFGFPAKVSNDTAIALALMGTTLLATVWVAGTISRWPTNVKLLVATLTWTVLLFLVFLTDSPFSASAFWSSYPLTTGALTSVLIVSVGALTLDVGLERARDAKRRRLNEIMFNDLYERFAGVSRAAARLRLRMNQGLKPKADVNRTLEDLIAANRAISAGLPTWMFVASRQSDDDFMDAVNTLAQLVTRTEALQHELEVCLRGGRSSLASVRQNLWPFLDDQGDWELRMVLGKRPPPEGLTTEEAEAMVDDLLQQSEDTGIVTTELLCHLSDLGALVELLRYQLDVGGRSLGSSFDLGLELLNPSIDLAETSPLDIFATAGTFREGLASLPGTGLRQPRTWNFPHSPLEQEWPELMQLRQEFADRHKDEISRWTIRRSETEDNYFVCDFEREPLEQQDLKPLKNQGFFNPDRLDPLTQIGERREKRTSDSSGGSQNPEDS